MPPFSSTGDPMNPTMGIPGAVREAFKSLVPPPQVQIGGKPPEPPQDSFWSRFKGLGMGGFPKAKGAQEMAFPASKEALAPQVAKGRVEQEILEGGSLGQKLMAAPGAIRRSEQERASMIAAPLSSPYAEVAQAKTGVVEGAIGEAEAAPLKGVVKAAREPIVGAAKGALGKLFHGSKFAEEIKKSGFKLKPGATSGYKGVYGEGIYLTNDASRAKEYGDVLEIAHDEGLKLFEPKDAIAELFSKKTDYGDPAKITEYVKSLGYDGIKITGEKGAQEVVIFDPAKVMLQEAAAKAAPVFKGFKDLTLKTLEKLKGRSTVSKQFIEDLAKTPDLKQPERDVLNQALAAVKGKTINVKEFAEKVKGELLPLEVTASGRGGRYEGITLPDAVRGPVENYQERIYQSPIKTSAGDVHFGGEDEVASGYFGHTRIEDIPDSAAQDRIVAEAKGQPMMTPAQQDAWMKSKTGSTRRVIEVQSDLYQKGGLEREERVGLLPYKELSSIPEEQMRNNGWTEAEIAQAKTDTLERGRKEAIRKKEIAPLQQYNDPTAHFRMIREEVKQAAKDGKTKLQFPTGETAMKVEGLGDSEVWSSRAQWDRFVDQGTPAPEKIGTADLKVGSEVIKSGIGYESAWVVTEVLENGKFKAVPQALYEALQNPDKKTIEALARRGETPQGQLMARSESFDASGAVNTDNPIYKFYEKDVAKYLKNKYGAKLVTDPQGVTWWEVDIKPDHLGPVEAFAAAPFAMMGLGQNREESNGESSLFQVPTQVRIK